LLSHTGEAKGSFGGGCLLQASVKSLRPPDEPATPIE
jgi:hypothetical protein